MIKIGLIILLCSTVIIAKRPNWYPVNGIEIEDKCMEKHSVSAETMAEIRKLHIEDTPEVRGLVLCCLKNTNVYRPDVGPEPDRIAVAFNQSLQLNCDMDMIVGCTSKYRDLQSEEEAYFSVIRCVYDEAAERCVTIKKTKSKLI